MQCRPELSVVKRKSLSNAKIAKRLRRFVRDHQQSEPPSLPNFDDDTAADGKKATNDDELICRIPDETLFQLQQIYEALEGDQGSSVGAGAAEVAGDVAHTPTKTPQKKKRPRGDDEAMTDVVERRLDAADPLVKKRKKDRRKSAAV